MYLVGLKNASWKLITDGKDTFIADKDVRHHSEFPIIGSERSGVNRVAHLQLSPEDLKALCLLEDIVLRGSSTRSEIVKSGLKQTAGPASVAGGIGALIGGPVGAVLGASVVGWLNSQEANEFQESNLENIFQGAKSKAERWQKFDADNIEFKTRKDVEYEKTARQNWDRYYRLRSISAVDALEGFEFEQIIFDIYRLSGYDVKLTPSTGDYGVDILAELNGRKLAIQAKRYSSNVGVAAVQEAVSGAFYYKADKAVVVTNSYFTANAKQLAKTLGVKLVDRDKLAALWEDAFPEESIPEFDMDLYEKEKYNILRLIRQSVKTSSKYDKAKIKDLEKRIFD